MTNDLRQESDRGGGEWAPTDFAEHLQNCNPWHHSGQASWVGSASVVSFLLDWSNPEGGAGDCCLPHKKGENIKRGHLAIWSEMSPICWWLLALILLNSRLSLPTPPPTHTHGGGGGRGYLTVSWHNSTCSFLPKALKWLRARVPALTPLAICLSSEGRDTESWAWEADHNWWVGQYGKRRSFRQPSSKSFRDLKVRANALKCAWEQMGSQCGSWSTRIIWSLYLALTLNWQQHFGHTEFSGPFSKAAWSGTHDSKLSC